MKLKQLTFSKLRNLQAFTPVLVVGLVVLTGAVIYNLSTRAAQPAGFSFNTSATTYTVGQTFNVSVYEHSGTQCANVAQADFTYPANLLRYNSKDSSGSKFESSIATNSGNGTVSMQQYTTRKECGTGPTATSGVAGEQLIGTVSFTVLAAGNATLTFQTSSIAVSAADNRTNVAPARTPRTLTLANVVAPPPPPPPPPTPGPAPQPQPQPTPQPTPQPAPRPTAPRPTAPRPAPAPTPAPVTSFTPPGSDQPIQSIDNDVVQFDAPVDVQPLPIEPDGVTKIEYYLGGKLKATVKTPPYTYKLDTTNMLNGKYVMTTKTYYQNGQSKSVNQTVIVNNKFGWNQFKLRMQKLAWLIILVLLLVGAGIAAWLIHRRGNGGDDFYDDGSYDDLNTGYVDPQANVVPPSGGPVIGGPSQNGTITNGTDWQPMTPTQPIALQPTPDAGQQYTPVALQQQPGVQPQWQQPNDSQNIIRPNQPPTNQ